MPSADSPSPRSDPRYPFLESRERFDDFLARWEAGRLTRPEWTHAAHVAVAAGYVLRYRDKATDELRRGIRRHNAAVGTLDTATSGYHETLTGFWSGVVARRVQGETDPWVAATRAVETFGESRDLHRLYYSFDVVKDTRARASFVPPDLVGPY